MLVRNADDIIFSSIPPPQELFLLANMIEAALPFSMNVSRSYNTVRFFYFRWDICLLHETHEVNDAERWDVLALALLIHLSIQQ